MITIPSNVAAPTTITLRFKSPVFGPDLTGVTAVTAGLLRRDSTSTSLTLTIVSATSRELIAQYTFAGGEVTGTGAYFLAPVLAVQGGSVPSETVPIFVGGPYNVVPQLEQDAWLLATVPIPSLGPVRSAWVNVATSITASPYGPNMALDLRSAPLSVTMWTALDGDIASFSDVYNSAASHTFTLVSAGGGSKVPVGDGTFASSVTRTTAGFALRLRYQTSSSLWLPW